MKRLIRQTGECNTRKSRNGMIEGTATKATKSKCGPSYAPLNVSRVAVYVGASIRTTVRGADREFHIDVALDDNYYRNA